MKSERQVTVVSNPKPVNMADEWFEIAGLNHFWIRRRFDVLVALLKNLNLSPECACEVGCGNGLVQRQIEDRFDTPVDGIDLNLAALRASVSRTGKLFYYDIFEERPEFQERYDFLILFDVLEHIEDQHGFLKRASEFLRPGGSIAINVPARQELFSAYDTQAGHLRRYSLKALSEVVEKSGLDQRVSTYWGYPLVPLLWARQRLLRNTSKEKVIRIGFSPRGSIANYGLSMLARLERIPNKVYGTSLMMIGQKPRP
ncbi:MAG: class I SAM-dependent methyltransferase [Verrucomicrobia bacterium]|nr:class I SAM-dependent methyltransferase [Verrucomicrobiota bacterium]